MVKKYTLALFVIVIGLFLPYGQVMAMNNEEIDLNELSATNMIAIIENQIKTLTNNESKEFLEKVESPFNLADDLAKRVKNEQDQCEVIIWLIDTMFESNSGSKFDFCRNILSKIFENYKELIVGRFGHITMHVASKHYSSPSVNHYLLIKYVDHYEKSVNNNNDSYLIISLAQLWLKSYIEQKPGDAEEMEKLIKDLGLTSELKKIDKGDVDTKKKYVNKEEKNQDDPFSIFKMPLITSALISTLNKCMKFGWKTQLLLHAIGLFGCYGYTEVYHKFNKNAWYSDKRSFGGHKTRTRAVALGYFLGGATPHTLHYLWKYNVRKRDEMLKALA